MFFNEDDGRAPLGWFAIDGGAYNYRDPKSNSDQDYEGYFYDPTEKVKDESYSNLTRATISHNLDFKDDYNKQFMSDYDIEHCNDTPTIKEKHYNFIKENFDFLEGMEE